MFRRKTLSTILASAKQTICDLREAATFSCRESQNNSEIAQKFMVVADAQENESAHASILADRMEKQLEVTQQEIDETIKITNES